MPSRITSGTSRTCGQGLPPGRKTGYRRRMARKPEDAKPKPRKFTVYLPADLIRELKIVAAREETSCTALVEKAAREIVKGRAG